MNMNSSSPDNYQTFISDLQIPGCVVQAGMAMTVEKHLTLENFAEYIEANTHKDLYFLAGVNPARDKLRARDMDILMKNHLFIDLDLRKKESSITDTEIKEIGYSLPETLATHPILSQWRYISFSGNGLHIHYFGDPVAIDTPESWKTGMENILRVFTQHTGIQVDSGCTNAARICRIPGSWNNKGGRHTKDEILLTQSEMKVDMNVIQNFSEETAKEPERGESSITEKKWKNGVEGVAEGSRHETAVSLAGCIIHDLREDLWETVGWNGLKALNEKNAPPMPEAELRKIFEHATQKDKNKRRHEGRRTGNAQQTSCEPVLQCLADVVREEVRWLWKDRIVLGGLNTFEGDPGTGKSWISLAIASAVTRGIPLPGEDDQVKRDPAKALLLTAEDSLSVTIKPRLEEMGADLSMVTALTAVRDGEGRNHHLSLEKNLDALEKVLIEGGYRLLIVDPLNAYLGSELDTNRDAALRSVLTPFTQMAERHRIAVLCIRHLTKSSRDRAIYRGQGSIAVTAAARVAHLIGKNPHNKDERIIACIKNNLAPFPPSFAFEFLEGRFLWKGETTVSPESLLGPEATEEELSAVDEAKGFLRDALNNGARRASEIFEEAKSANIAERTLKRAKEKMKINARKDGFGKEGYWIWELPTTAKEASTPTSEPSAPFDTKNTS